jgi:hypothetical protein
MIIEPSKSFENFTSVERTPSEAEPGWVADKYIRGYFKRVTQGLSKQIESESRLFASRQLKSLSNKLDDVAQVLGDTAKTFRKKQKNMLADNRYWILLGGAVAAGVLVWRFSSRPESAQPKASDAPEQLYGPH